MKRSFDSLMLRVLLTPLLAAIQIFALYVVLHGHYSPGGGFQGGVLLGCSVLLPLLVLKRPPAARAISERTAITLSVAGVLVFAGIGIAALAAGARFLDYGALPLGDNIAARRSLGILGIELGVTTAVAGVVVSLFYSLASSREEP